MKYSHHNNFLIHSSRDKQSSIHWCDALLPSLIRKFLLFVSQCLVKVWPIVLPILQLSPPATELRRWSQYRHGHPAPWSPGPAYKQMSDVRSKCPYCVLTSMLTLTSYIDTVMNTQYSIKQGLLHVLSTFVC